MSLLRVTTEVFETMNFDEEPETQSEVPKLEVPSFEKLSVGKQIWKQQTKNISKTSKNLVFKNINENIRKHIMHFVDCDVLNSDQCFSLQLICVGQWDHQHVQEKEEKAQKSDKIIPSQKSTESLGWTVGFWRMLLKRCFAFTMFGVWNSSYNAATEAI